MDLIPPKPHTWHTSKPAVELKRRLGCTYPVPADIFDTLGRHSSCVPYDFANLWCVGGVFLLSKKSGGEMNALLRTTVAFTQASGSQAPNVIPPTASFVANLRLNPYDTVDSAVEHIRRVVNDDSVNLTVMPMAINPSAISEAECPAWDMVATTILETWPGCIVSSYLMVVLRQPPLRQDIQPCLPLFGRRSYCR